MAEQSFTKSFFQVCRELALAFGIAILIPFITHYTVLIVHPAPLYPIPTRDYYDSDTDLTVDRTLSDQFKQLKEQRKRLQAEENRLLERTTDSASRLAIVQEDLRKVAAAQDDLLARNKIEEDKKEAARKAYEAARAAYDRTYFFIALAIGIMSIIIGMFIPLVSLGVGFILGGFASLIIGYVTYWGALHTIIKLLSLLCALGLILMISFSRFGRQKE